MTSFTTSHEQEASEQAWVHVASTGAVPKETALLF